MTDTAPDPTAEFDVASLDPANLAMGFVPASSDTDATPPDTTDTPTGVTDSPAGDAIDQFLASQMAKPKEETPSTPSPTTPTTPDTPAKPEAVNMRKLRELREAAEKERDQLKTEREELAAKLADLEPRAKNYEAEKAALEARLAETEKAAAEAQAAVWRQNARERPEWRQTAEKIHGAAAQIEEMLKLPALAESGLRVSPAILLDPNARQALNETVRLLNESGHYAEATLLVQQHIEVNKMRGTLREIEQATAAEAEQWTKNAEAAELDVLRRTREELAGSNPVFDVRSSAFTSLPKEQQEFLASQMAAAETAAREMRALAGRPEAILAAGYKTHLALRLAQQSGAGLQAQLASATKELGELKARLAAYEKAAGGGAPTGATKPGTAPESVEDIASMLDPRNLPGYRGML